MWHTLQLLLPALIPSWNFFDIIAPSPRIHYALLTKQGDIVHDWQEVRPRPARVSFFRMLRRMLWNPHWNESLFMMSCAERLLDYPTQHSEDEILKRIAHELLNTEVVCDETYLQFRLILIKREGEGLRQEQVYDSARVPMSQYLNTGGRP